MFIYKNFRFRWAWVWGTLWVSALIVFNSRLYFVNWITPVFLLEKGKLVENALWYTSFRFHVIASCACLLIGAAIMLDSNLRFRQLHTIFGNLYVWLVLWITVPTGLILAPTAKGGLLSTCGFILTGCAMWMATWMGYQAIKRGNIQRHIIWMVRSYSLGLTAVFFRVTQLALVGLGCEAIPAYVASVWISLIVSISVAELCIFRQFPNHKFDSFNFSNLNGVDL